MKGKRAALKFSTFQHSSNILLGDIWSIEIWKTYCIENYNIIIKFT